MQTREYRLTKLQPGLYIVTVCYGLMDTISLNNGEVFLGSKLARDAIKAHAKMAQVKPLILTD